MALYDETLDDLVENCCKLFLNDWVEGTATGGSTTTVVDTSRLEQDDYFNSLGAYVYIRSGTYAGSWRKITDFAGGSTNTLTFSPALAGAIAVGVTYSIHTEFERNQVVSAINLAIDMVAKEALAWKKDETSVTLAADTYEYNLPTDFMYIHKITMADGDGDFYDPPIPPDHYRIIPGAVPKLHFIKFPDDLKFEGHDYDRLWRDEDFTTSRALRIEGMGSPDVLSSDSDTCPINPYYVITQAAAILHMGKSRGAANDPDDHYKQGVLCQTLADKERKNVVKVQLPINSKRCIE